MGSVQLNQNGDCIEDTSMEQLLSSDSSDYNVFGDPELLPRVGDQYQVEIPALMTESERLLYKKSPFEVDFAPSVPSDFLMGLSIPIMWIKGTESFDDSNGKSNKNRVLKSETNKETQMYSRDKDSKVKFEPVDVACGNGIGSGESKNLALEREMDRKMHKYPGEEYYLVPGSYGSLWSDIEEASFLLGLYIFGKNLVQVKKFIESKTMRDVQSFYYGKFYRSDKYRRWSDCRKMRSRRCVYGQRIFTGWRQQELSSRLFSRVSEECQNTLLEVSKTFGDGKMSLEEYVSTLKAIVGMNSLVEAVGIGKGKRDLTGITMEPLKSNHVVQIRPEVPSGKACSSLTPTEIIKFLTGDFRLSKARSNDLFWEAVWPRLLARGWHSEQPKDQSYAAGSKNCLVFLMPGVKKFSRRKLAKGDHYFDSITDVLSKVSSDPGLLELENEAMKATEARTRMGGLMKQSWTEMTCLIVDVTVISSLELRIMVRELRTLPNKVSKTSVSRSDSEESNEDSSKSSSEDSDCVDTMSFDQEDTSKSKSTKTVSAIGTFFDEKDREIGDSKRGTKGLDSGTAFVKTYKELPKFCENKHPRKSPKCSRGMKQDDLDYLAPVTKRHRRLSACNREETSHRILSFSQNPSLEQEKHIFSSETTDSSGIISIGWVHLKSGSHPPIHRKAALLGAVKAFLVIPTLVLMINLIPDPNRKISTAPDPSADVPFSEPNMNSRRHSTRNRPLTARALEALANGFLTTTRRRKNKEACPRQNSNSRPPRQARGGPELTESFTSGTVASQMIEVGNGACTDNSDTFGEFQREMKFVSDPKSVLWEVFNSKWKLKKCCYWKNECFMI
ncbi:uncharacterized protein LOC130764573 [Actinidia eriantha]|uniref:uncharacterized protein LOC130764573 n=1 Tax=Actinidia eriantha TaxID=165200 RepID=UPI00258DC641|nr:uncharacterized protein LOC130764573 [Actinidia eriantha]